MEPRERHHDDERHGGAPDDGASHEGLDALREAGEGFLAAGDEAIRRALSGDSEAFLRANRQRGGQ
jgi:hypothetical protein